jgi:hypothetical protein
MGKALYKNVYFRCDHMLKQLQLGQAQIFNSLLVIFDGVI